MSNDKQIQKRLELPHRETLVGINTIQTNPFDNQKTTTMSNNKQSSVEWYIIERHIIEIQSRLGLISPIEYDAKLIKIEEQAKAMHKEEIVDANWEASEDTERAEQYYNETFGGNNDQRDN